jgi:putative tryptophan/tyrosine transport system substrate-binding protein
MLIGSTAAAWPLAARAQQGKVTRIGALYIGLADAESFRKELRQGLRELGYMEGQNIAFEFRSAEGQLDRLPGLAAELVQLKVDVIVTLYVPPALAAKDATREIPIVAIVGDPVETGIVSSLARPGGNITGVSLMASALAGKSVELFRDMLPSARRVGVLGHSTNPVFAKAMLDEVLPAAGPTGLEIQPVVMVRGPDEFEGALTTMVRERADAVVVQGSLAVKSLADMALKYRLPMASTTRAFADIGGLMSFGADGPAAFRHATIPEQLGAKGIKLLREVLPGILRLGELYQGDKPGNLVVVKGVESYSFGSMTGRRKTCKPNCEALGRHLRNCAACWGRGALRHG